MTGEQGARLLGPRPKRRHVSGIALLLPGGDEESTRRLPALDVSVVRMRMFGPAVSAVSAGRVAPVTLKYTYAGWNEPDRPALQDGRWALSIIAHHFPGYPVVLIGHSMGGRVAMHLADTPNVAGVCLLAPWLTETESSMMLGEKPLLVLHSPRDFATDPDASRELVEDVQTLGLPARFKSMRYDNHPMMLRAVSWHAQAARFATSAVMRVSKKHRGERHLIPPLW